VLLALSGCGKASKNEALILSVYHSIEVGDSENATRKNLKLRSSYKELKLIINDNKILAEVPFYIGNDWRGIEVLFKDSLVSQVKIISWDNSNVSPFDAPPIKGYKAEK